MNCLAFDIETVPDVEFGRRLYGLDDMDDADVAEAMFYRRRLQTGSDFLPHPQQRVVAISVVLRSGADTLRVWSLGDPEAGEAEIVSRFFEGIERFSPDLVSWNGGGFDLPVLHYRALRHGVQTPRYWEIGESDTSFRYNNYLSRFHWRHVDLMDVLSGYQFGGRARLEEVALMLGLPGKLGMSGDQVWSRYLGGDIGAIRNYCETDALNTYLIYLYFEHMRGRLDDVELSREFALAREAIAATGEEHWRQFLDNWQAPSDS